MTRTSLRISTRYLLILLLASSVPGCTFLSGIEDTKKDKDKARTFDDPAASGRGGAAGNAGAGGAPSVSLEGGAGGSDVGAAGTDAGTAGADAAGAAGAEAGGAAGAEAGGEGGSS